jgi:peptide/nickel transport system substrate-binding protein
VVEYHGTARQLTAGFQGLNPGTGAPQRGGTLNMVGISDVDYMDYDTGYYTTDYQVARLTVRQLYGFPADPAKTTTPMPDLATALPVISDNGLKQTVTLRSGVMWNTNPPRPVTVADVVRGIKRACNPSPVFFGGMADFEATIKGLTEFCAGYPEKAGTDAAALKQYVEGHNVSGITTSGNTITFELTQPAPWLVGAMTMSPFSAVPIEAENALPGTPGVYNHMYSDGPYQHVVHAEEGIQVHAQPGMAGEQRPAAQGVRERHQRGRDRQPDHDLPADAHQLAVAGDELSTRWRRPPTPRTCSTRSSRAATT